jgi:hypothetical protein
MAMSEFIKNLDVTFETPLKDIDFTLLPKGAGESRAAKLKEEQTTFL